MTERLNILKCGFCGNIVEVMHAGAGKMKCCGAAMSLLSENTVDAAVEKHVPVVSVVEGGVTVKVGDVAHPMEAEHYIEWIEVVADGNSHTRFLNPGDAPEASFAVSACEITVRAYCNLHGHWKA